jgi:phosphate transport system substrate-binding protein
MVGGTIAIAYNKPGCNLKLTQKQVVDVFNGKINDWKQLNCASGPITVVHRSDGSGTTFAFTNSLREFSPSWTAGVAKSVNWPTGIGAKGNEGVSALIKQKAGTLGYVSYTFVKGNRLQAAAVQNKAGKFVFPNANSGSAALNQIQINPVTLAGENPNPAGASSYPISTLTWILAYKTGNGSKTDAVRSTLNYMLSAKAQMIADDLGYVPLSGSILNKARIAVNRIGN